MPNIVTVTLYEDIYQGVADSQFISVTIAETVAVIGGGGSGVTSVAMTVPTGFTVTGSPITTTGTFALAYSAGYVGYTTAEQTKLSGIETGADVTDSGNVGSVVAGVTEKTTPVDADTMPLTDSAAANVLKKVSWANIKATLKSYFDTLYAAIVHTHTAADITDFDTEVSNNTDVAANTLARHDAVTVSDTDDIDFTLTGQQISASIKATAISSKTTDTLSGTEEVLVNDAGTLKKTTVQDIADLGGGGGGMALYTPNKFYYKNDYLVIASDGSFGAFNFQNISSGSGATIGFEVSEKDTQGIVRIHTGTTTTGRGAWWHPKAYDTICLGDNGLKMWFKFKLGEAIPDATEDYVIRHGIAQNVSGDSANEVVFIIGRGINSGKLTVRYRSASVTRFDLDTTITPSTSWQECYLEMDASTHVITVYDASGTLLATSSAPATKITNTQRFTMTDNINKLAGTTNRTFYSDYFIMELT